MKDDTGKNWHSGAMAVPPFAPGKAKVMERAAPKAPGGKSFKLDSNAKYGTEGIGGPEPTTMSRSTKKSKGGSGASSLPPGNADRCTKGVEARPHATCYGVSGVEVGGNAGQYRGT